MRPPLPLRLGPLLSMLILLMLIHRMLRILRMMYLALSYDHRLIDGKEAVSFLVAIKDLLEDPARLLLDV